MVIFWFLLLHLISTLFSAFYRRKSGIFRFAEEKRSLLGNRCWVSFLRIPYSHKFLAVLSFSLVCLAVICRTYVCTRKINFQYVDFFCFLMIVFRCLLQISLVSCENKWTSFPRHCALRGNFLHLVFTFDLYSFPYYI